METLYAFGMMVGLMQSFAEPPKVVAPPAPAIEQHRVAEAVTAQQRQRPAKAGEWRLDY